MKKNLGWLFARTVLVIVLLFLAGGTYSQQLWGMTSDGGSKKTGGNIFSISADGTDFTEHFAFFNDAERPLGGRLLDYGDGFLYGVGGIILYRHLPDGSAYEAVYVFEESTGTLPQTRLLKGPDGYLYGATYSGGNYSYGVVYKVQKNGTGYQVLHHFNGTNGRNPRGNVIQFIGGLLYGTTTYGGTSGHGVVYRLESDGTGFQVLHSFNGANGSLPIGGVVSLTVNGTAWLYGVTHYGGNNDEGVIYRIKPDGTNFSRQYNFNNSSGLNPRGPLIKIGNVLYGVTNAGGTWNNNGGVIFAYDADADSYQKLHQYVYDSSAGFLPVGPLLNINGVLYGTTYGGGNFSKGLLYKINPNGNNYQVIHHFKDKNAPEGSLAWINNKIYGLTSGFNADLSNPSGGTIYRINTDGTGFETIYNFSDANGYEPHGSLIQGQLGRLYGLAKYGGNEFSNGLAFSIQSNGTNYKPLQLLGDGQANGGPEGSLVQSSNGSFYGMNRGDGLTLTGSIFSISFNFGNFYQRYFPFCPAPDCAKEPTGSLIQASDGHLYGMTPYTGQGTGQGNIFRIATNGTHYTSIKILNGSSEGANPKGSLVQAPDGFLYGMTENGGLNGFGVIFKIKTDGSGFQTIFQFGQNISALDGGHPKGSLLLGSDGKLYGMANAGGSSGGGTIFSINTSGGEFTVLHNFNFTNGAFPVASLVEDVNTGYLFGMTKEGGVNNLGTIFKIKKDGTGFQKLLDFNGTNGKYPMGDLLIIPFGIISGQRPIFKASEEKKLTDGQLLNIYPNPVQQSITISFPEPVSGRIDYSLLDVQGKKLVMQTTANSFGIRVKTIDVSFLPAGMYLLEISTPEKKITKKIFKQ